MKSIKLTLMLILLSSSLAFGQNYQTVNSKRISYFDNQYGNIRCIRIDSIKHHTDSTFYPLSNIRELNNGCFSPFGPSWIGEKIIIKENGQNIFFNKNHDSILLRTKALLNDNWTAFNLPDSIKVIATINKIDTLSFMGQLDTVKSIGFHVYDKNMIPLDHILNSMELKISKNFGFVTTFNFYLFPNLTDLYPEQFENYSLIGLSNPEIGIQNLTWFEINDFQIGDELHIVNEYSSWGGYLRSLKTICKYLSRSDYDDSIVYTYSQKGSLYVTSPDTSFYDYINRTAKQVIISDPQFDKLPGEPIMDEGSSIFSYSMENDSVLSKFHPNHEVYFFSYDSCWEPLVLDDCLVNFKYLKGLGGPYYDCDNFMSDEVTKLVYYKKGEITWGTPIIITGISDRPDEININVFPNPAHDYLTIQFQKYDQTEIFEILDITGRIILKKNIVSEESTVRISDLKPGSYLYRLRNNNKVLKIDKLVIE